MQKQTTKSNFVITNVVSTGNLNQTVDIKKFNKFGWGIYDQAIYHGRCGYVKSSEMKGRVTIFPSGKMISVGAKSIEKANEQLENAKFYLIKAKLITEVKLEPKIQNIVAVLTLPHKLHIKKALSKLHGAIYEPDQFAGIILKSIFSVSYLIFASGKIVIVGAKSEKELSRAAFEITQRLEVKIEL